MAMTLEEFRLEYPEFAAVPDLAVERQLANFSCLYTLDYGCQSDYLQGLFAAHQLYVKYKKGGGAVGSMTGRTVGDVSTQWAQSSSAASAADFASSKYGLEFYRLISMFGMGPLITGNNCVRLPQ